MPMSWHLLEWYHPTISWDFSISEYINTVSLWCYAVLLC